MKMKEIKNPDFATRLYVILTTLMIAGIVKYFNQLVSDSTTLAYDILFVLMLFVFYRCIVYFVKLYKGTLIEEEKDFAISIKFKINEKTFSTNDKFWYYQTVISISVYSILSLFVPIKIEDYDVLITMSYIIFNAGIDIYRKFKK